MKNKILKFGGTSVANAENIRKVIQIVSARTTEEKLIVIVSALGGTTDQLLQTGHMAAAGNEAYKDMLAQVELRHLETVKELIPVQQQSGCLSLVKKNFNELEDLCNGILLLGEFSNRSKDKLLSYGEYISSKIIAVAFSTHDLPATWKDARELVLTNSNFGNAAVDFSETNKRIKEFFETAAENLFILPGFIATDSNGVTTTLGRGGSDYTAAIIAAALDAGALEIWTDVSGMMTADPRWVPHAKIIPEITYLEAMELSHFGAKVIYPPTIQPVLGKKIPILIRNTFSPEDTGTVIMQETKTNGNFIRGISSISGLALLSLEGSGMIGVPGFSKRLFEALSNAGINVILITQGSSEHSICVGVDELSAGKAKEVVDDAFASEIAFNKVEPLQVERELSIVALVGEHMKSHPGISGKMFGALGRNGVNVRAIAQGSSERNISAVVATRDVRKAINVLHEEFFEAVYKQVNLYIAGTGNVGSRFMAQLQQQLHFLNQHYKLQVRVIGIANSRRMLMKDDGISLDDWDKKLAEAPPASLDDFVQNIIKNNFRNSVFVDITASDTVATVYEKLLQKSISVVACNKVAASSAYGNYKKLKELAREYNTLFLFETNVGAGLPVIGTLGDLLRSGDTVHRIEAVLSGTLNFVFNHYDGSRSFAEVVRQAQDEGYTEPDPRMDLGGTDVMRKIMILAREAGEEMEMEQISNHSFMPESCMQGDVDNFYREMAKHEPHFQKLYKAAADKNCKLKFVAKFEDGKASVGLEHIDPRQDFYHLYGKDNVVLFYTDRYKEQPLVIKGAGAGAEVTASGVFADVMRAARL